MARSRRRARGEGSVFHRKDGYWVAQIELGDGKRKQYYLKTQKEAVDKLRKAQRELEQGTLVTGPQQTVKQYLEYWLEEVHKSSIKVSTYVKYGKLIKGYIIPALGHLKLEKLTPQHVKSLYNQKQKDGLSAKTINSIHGVLHKALDNAVLWNLVSRNVCDVVSPPRLVKPEKHSLTMEQAHRLLEGVRGHRLEMLLTLALTTGLRRGEMLALRWNDVDLEHQTVVIYRFKNYRFPYNLPRCQALSAKRFSHIMWRGIVRNLFSLLCFFFRQIPRLVRQDIWKMRQEMPEKSRIFDTPQVYLLLRGKRHAISARQKR
jgi:integrase